MKISNLLILFAILHLQACGFWDDEASLNAYRGIESRTPAAVQAPPLPTEIEVVWKVPEEAVDGYVIKYKLSGASEDKEIQVDRATLIEEQTEEFGSIYRYRLRGVPSTRGISVTLAAVKDGVRSSFSPVMATPNQ